MTSGEHVKTTRIQNALPALTHPRAVDLALPQPLFLQLLLLRALWPPLAPCRALRFDFWVQAREPDFAHDEVQLLEGQLPLGREGVVEEVVYAHCTNLSILY